MNDIRSVGHPVKFLSFSVSEEFLELLLQVHFNTWYEVYAQVGLKPTNRELGQA